MKEAEFRARSYNQAFPDWPPLAWTDDWFYGVWIIGNDYRNASRYYGAYPHGYLKRIDTMFQDKTWKLDLFSGSLTKADVPGSIRFDIKAKDGVEPDVQGDAENLSSYFSPHYFDLVRADPAYSGEDALHYGSPMVNRNKVMSELAKIVMPGGYVVWLDQVLPMYRKDDWDFIGTIGLIRSTNHRFRVVCFFMRKGNQMLDHKMGGLYDDN